jgi:hypothetical protein
MGAKSILVGVATFTVGLGGAERAFAQTVSTTVPSTVASSPEWGATTVKNPMDMNQWNDVGWYNYSVDLPAVDLSGVSHGACTATSGASPTAESGTMCLKATKSSSGGNIFILDSPVQSISTDIHKSGTHFPIDASTYTTIVVRMRLTSATPGQCPPTTPLSGSNIAICTAGYRWWPTSLYATPDGNTRSASFVVYEGWGIYFMNIPNLGYATSPPAQAWSGLIRALRLELAGAAGAQIEVDWIRLVPAGASRTIGWSGYSGAVDIYLDSNTSQADGNLGIVTREGNVFSVSQSGSSFSFDPAGLAPGTYYAKVCNAGSTPTSSSSCRYSSAFVVNDIPVLTFTSPSPDGSSDDFATTVLGNAWDMNALTDLDYYVNNTATPAGSGINEGLSVTTISDAVDETGAAVGPFTALMANNSALGDPYIYPLWYNTSPVVGRGVSNKIDANKYHILTIEAGLPNRARDVNAGSIARVLWQVEGERGNGGTPKHNVSGDILFNHRAGYNVMTRITADMSTLALETDSGASPSTTGWRGTIESFRFDPYEQFGTAGLANQAWWIKRIKLAANERFTSGTTYNITWSYTDSTSSGPTLTLSYDTDTDPSSGLTTIVSGISPSAGSYSWNTSGVPNGTYYIYASYSDGYNANGSYSRWPIIVGPLIGLSATPSLLNYIATKSGSSLIFQTPPQTVSVSMTGATAAWTASANQSWLQITNGSGTGSGQFTVSLVNPSDVIGASENLSAIVTISAPSIGATTTVAVTLRIKPAGTSDLPFGSFDTPTSSSTALSGSFAVTGWALDDIGINRVEIWRDRASGETTPVFSGSGPANGKIFIANAFFVQGARPDIAAARTDHPFHTRAGWGYLLLSYGLYNQGNGPFTLYAFAYDTEGNVVTLGSKSIVVSNSAATKPFGSIDVPSYGQTVSGSFFNFGWALTPNATPSCVVNNGSVYMSIDSGSLTAVSYGDPRTDIAAAFPGFTNGSNAGGAFFLNTTTLSNGTHQIGWYVVDSCGRAEGVGSRFFDVLNSGTGTIPSDQAGQEAARAAEAVQGPAQASVETEPARVRRHDGEVQTAAANSHGVRIVAVSVGERIEIELPRLENAAYSGAGVTGAGRGPLPTGSSLDARTGTFYWEPAPGFLGGFDLEFVAIGSGEQRTTLVRVVVGPPMRTTIDLPWNGATVQQPFWLSGWTGDLAANEGTGIDAVHVWAYPVGQVAPVFLGFGLLGDARPDVATVYGRQFERSAYNVLVSNLRPGVYDIVAYPHRVATNTFDGAQVVRVVVR